MHPHGSTYSAVFRYGETSYKSWRSLKKPSTTVIGILQSATVPWHKWSVHRVFLVPWSPEGKVLEGRAVPGHAKVAWPAWMISILFRTSIFDWFLEPKLGQNGPKMWAKIHPKSIQNLNHFLIDFWIWFCSQNGHRNGSQNHQKSFTYPSRSFSNMTNVIFSKIWL